MAIYRNKVDKERGGTDNSGVNVGFVFFNKWTKVLAWMIVYSNIVLFGVTRMNWVWE